MTYVDTFRTFKTNMKYIGDNEKRKFIFNSSCTLQRTSRVENCLYYLHPHRPAVVLFSLQATP